jgi:glutaminyl-peptide cyclotransferase
MRTPLRILLAVTACVLVQPFVGCDGHSPSAVASAPATNAVADSFPTYTYEVVNVYPHDRAAFTEGLFLLNGDLYESTGLNGQSTLREEDLETGKVLKMVQVPEQYFGEGIAALNGKLYQLTWQNQLGFIYDQASFRKLGEFTYQGEGWGFTTDGKSLIMSNGSNQIRFLDPDSLEETRRITVMAHGQPLNRLNELEYIKGEIYANIWGTDFIVRIDPADGRVLGVVDFSGLLPSSDRDAHTDVLNGIAYDAAKDRLFVTGKCWPKLFEVRLRPKP